MSERPQFRASYASAFEAYLVETSESALHAAYELGREAVRRELSVLDLAAIHHDVLLFALLGVSDAEEIERVARSAADFFLESLSAFEMIRRGFREAREAALLERRHAAMLRQLSNFLADASLALSATDTLEEIVQLLAEHARELIGARCCVASVMVTEGEGRTIQAISSAEGDPACAEFLEEADLAAVHASARASGSFRMTDAEVARHAASRALAEAGQGSRLVRGWLGASLTTLDGHDLGFIHLFDKAEGQFSEVDEAVLVQLAQMASASVERAELYRRKR